MIILMISCVLFIIAFLMQLMYFMFDGIINMNLLLLNAIAIIINYGFMAVVGEVSNFVDKFEKRNVVETDFFQKILKKLR